MAGRETFGSCYAEFEGGKLVVGNALFERAYQIELGKLYAVTMTDKVAGFNWIASRLDWAAGEPPGRLSWDESPAVFTASVHDQMPVSKPSLRVSLRCGDTTCARIHEFEIYPDSASVTCRLTLAAGDLGFLEEARSGDQRAADPSGVELLDNARRHEGPPEQDTLDGFALVPQHLKLTQVRLMDRTDVHNELVFENEWLLLINENNLRLQGNVFVIEDNLTGNGLVVLKHAPLPHARPVGCACDLLVRGNDRSFRFYGHGMGQGVGDGYAQTVMAYQNGAVGRQEAIQTFQRQLRAYDPDRDGKFLSNTWGDRSQDSRIQEAFMLKEVAAGQPGCGCCADR